MAQNLSELWTSSDFSNKQQLQYLIYPDGIRYSKENNAGRTQYPNAIFTAIQPLAWVLEDKKRGNLTEDCLKYSPVTLAYVSSNSLFKDLQKILDFDLKISK